MSGDGHKFFLGINGEQAGPFSVDEVRQKLAGGEINNETLVWYEGLSEWQALHTITYFAAAPAASSAALAPAASAAPVATETVAPPPEPDEDDPREKTIAAVAAPAPVAGKFKPLSQVLGGAPSSASAASDNDPDEPSITGHHNRPSRPLPERATAPERHQPAWKKKGKKPASPEKGEVILTFAISGKRPRAVFNAREGSFGGKSPIMMTLLGGGALAVAALGIYLLIENSDDNLPTTAVVKKSEPRDVRLARAKENVILNPAIGLSELRRLLDENAKDDVGKAAYQALELSYWEKQDYKGLGDLALALGDNHKAVEFYLKDPRLVAEAEKAYVALFGSAIEPAQKKKALLSQIELLLGPLKRKAEAITQIQLFEKTFPGEPHPYQYYTLPLSQQIAELFERTSYYFLANLNGFIEGEFPHMKLAHPPSVEVRREDGRYRITGTYKGDVNLYRDKLKNVYLHFWLNDGQWYVVETNITADRKKYAADKKETLLKKTSDENSILKYLESIFEQEFPRTPLHERAPRNTAASAPRGEDAQ